MGKMVLQAITIPDRRYKEARDSVDYIKRYIFPGGCLPSLSVMAEHVSKDTDMQMVHLRDITEDYATTLARWRERFYCRLMRSKKWGSTRILSASGTTTSVTVRAGSESVLLARCNWHWLNPAFVFRVWSERFCCAACTHERVYFIAPHTC